jgi:hypothetical protein
MDDLCTVQNVKSRGYIQGDFLDSTIADWIIDMSEEIRFESDNGDTLTSDNLDVRRACIYGVLMWLEEKRLIPSSRLTYQEHEGNISVSHEERSGDPKAISQYATHNSYAEQYKMYMARLVAYTPIGSTIKCIRPFYYGYGSYREGY